jgi:hypothetical protein
MMRGGEEAGSSVHRELATLDERLRAAERDAVVALSAVGAIVTVMTVIGGWAAV